MKAITLRVLTAGALAAAGTAHAAAPAQSPEAVTDLFLRTLIQADPAAMKSLNDYTRPVRVANKAPGDFINIPEKLEADKDYAKDLAPVFLQQLKMSDADKAALEPTVVKFMQSLHDAQKRTVCTTGKAETVTEGVPKKSVAVNVPFECKVVNPPEKLKAFLQRAAGSNWKTVAQYREAIDKLRVGYETAPLTQDWRGALPLISDKKPVVWQNIFPNESVDITEALF